MMYKTNELVDTDPYYGQYTLEIYSPVSCKSSYVVYL